MPTYTFTTQEKNQYFSLEPSFSGFGKQPDRDYIVLGVYTLSGQLLQEKKLSLSDIEFGLNKQIVMDVGQHLRDCGYTEGNYKVKYKFLRKIAGEFDNQEFKYNVDNISTNRREVIISNSQVATPINPGSLKKQYLEDFITMNSTIDFEPPNSSALPNISFEDVDKAIIKYSIDQPAENHFFQDMVGGELQIRDFLQTSEASYLGKFKVVEVLDENRLLVDKTFRQCVEAFGVNADGYFNDHYMNSPGSWFVRYKKFNTDNFQNYMVTDDNYYLMINDKLTESNDNTRQYKRAVRFKTRLLNNISQFQKVYFAQQMLNDYEDNITLVPNPELSDEVFLRIPNLNSVDNPLNFSPTLFQSHNDLLSDDDPTNKDIERLLVSSSLLDVQPNIDYQKTTTDLTIQLDDTGFGNFVNFSNAERRITNFKTKVELIESHSAESRSLAPIADSLKFVQSVEDKRQRVINSFDPFEHFMYFESSSYVSSSEGQFHDTAWPKQTSTEPYVLAPTTASVVTTWYNNMVASASTYDNTNQNSLRNTLPGHVQNDSQNNVFLEFMDMIGQQFDETWTYTTKLTDVNIRVEKLSEGISKDIAQQFARSLGVELTSGNNLLTLPEYLLGRNQDGTNKYESPQEKVTEEIWKRILANLPFFIKAKGTRRAMTGLLNCYGIPSSILRVREYGGPDKGTGVNYEIKRKFTHALDFKSEQFIKSQWSTDSSGLTPDTIEFRFRTPSSSDQVLLQKNNDFAISLQDNGASDNLGHLKFQISASGFDQGTYITSSELPFYNDDFWSVMLTRKAAANRTDGLSVGDELTTDIATSQSIYELTTKQYDSTRQRVIYEDSQSLTSHTSSLATDINNISGSRLNGSFTSSGFVFLGGQNVGFGGRFSGSMMEYRLWSEPLSSNVFDNHTRTPKAYNGNSYSSSFDELLVRYMLNDNISFSASNATLTSSNVAHLQTYERAISGSNIDGFTGTNFRSLVDQEQFRVPDVGPSRRNATKIRIEDNKLVGNLSAVQRAEKSSQDFAPIDSDRLGVYFSPVDVVNEDIVYSIADFNFDDYIGDPRDEFKHTYRTLKSLQIDYFKRYQNSNNFFDYLRLLTYYDTSIFTQLRNLIPARANETLGVLIEPSILERPKAVPRRQTEFDNQYFENASPLEDGLQVTRFISESLDNALVATGEFPTYGGDLVNNRDLSGSVGRLGIQTLVKLDEIDPTSPYGDLYATASVVFGGTTTEFEEVVQPFISSSRLSPINQDTEKFYSSSISASLDKAYSSSFVESEFQSVISDSYLENTFFIGTKVTKDNAPGGGDAVEITLTSPTSLTTQEPGESKLRVE